MVNEIMYNSKRIYEHFVDDKSKFIFTKRLLYGLTGEYQYILDIINNLDQKKPIDELIGFSKTVRNRLIVYGAGNDLDIISELYPDLDYQFLCDMDANKQKTGWRGKTVISPDRLFREFKDYYILINTTGFYNEIYDTLLSQGIKKEQILNLGSLLGAIYEKQYFESNIMIPSNDEIFVDGGCYNCHTDRLFINWCKGNYRKIYAFEPDLKNYNLCLLAQEKYEISNLVLINKGLWDCEETLYFEERANQGSRIDSRESNTTIQIDTTSIDQMVVDEKVTFIKLDVEGAELKALQGARNTIIKNHPKLAISIYHKDEDVITIPEYILSLSEEYRFYLRHYQLSANETILYAV